MSWRALTVFLVMGLGIFVAGCQSWTHSNQYGRFERVGDMHFSRSGHTATLLQDGRVLIAGGNLGEHYRKELEIYDPKTRRFTLAGSLHEKHYGQNSAALLKDGRVVFIGGPAEHIEIYDPRTQKAEIAAKTLVIRGFHTVTVLQSGQVLSMGGVPKSSMRGSDFDGPRLGSSEIFNPKTSKVSQAGQMAVKRTEHQAFLLKNGQVFITGGDLLPFGQTEFYNENSNKFTLSQIRTLVSH